MSKPKHVRITFRREVLQSVVQMLTYTGMTADDHERVAEFLRRVTEELEYDEDDE
jgi:hypothetical protein